MEKKKKNHSLSATLQCSSCSVIHPLPTLRIKHKFISIFFQIDHHCRRRTHEHSLGPILNTFLVSLMRVVPTRDDSRHIDTCARHHLADECGDTSMGVDDDGAELAIKRATDASRCSDALERENGELFECEKGREWCTRNTSTIHKNVLCQCAALIELKKK